MLCNLQPEFCNFLQCFLICFFVSGFPGFGLSSNSVLSLHCLSYVPMFCLVSLCVKLVVIPLCFILCSWYSYSLSVFNVSSFRQYYHHLSGLCFLYCLPIIVILFLSCPPCLVKFSFVCDSMFCYFLFYFISPSSPMHCVCFASLVLFHPMNLYSYLGPILQS